MLCVSDDAASLLLYRSILELDGHNTLVAANGDAAIRESDGIAIDCIVVDCAQNGISVTRRISRAWPDIPILFVSDRSELQLQIYSETSMFVTKDEAIEDLSRCIREVIQRDVHGRMEDGRRRISTGWTNVESRPFHDVLVRWLLPW